MQSIAYDHNSFKLFSGQAIFVFSEDTYDKSLFLYRVNSVNLAIARARARHALDSIGLTTATLISHCSLVYDAVNHHIQQFLATRLSSFSERFI